MKGFNHLLPAVAFLSLMLPLTVKADAGKCLPVTHAKVPIEAETTYAKARADMLKAGWQPVQTVRWQEVDDKLDSDAKIRWRNGQQEVEWCVMSSGECRFLFKDVYGNYLRVSTTGEGDYANVSKFEFTCAP